MPAVGLPGPTELLIILAIVLIIFGPSKLKGLGKGLGTSLREFRDAVSSKDEPGPPESKPPSDSPSSADS